MKNTPCKLILVVKIIVVGLNKVIEFFCNSATLAILALKELTNPDMNSVTETLLESLSLLKHLHSTVVEC